MSSANVENELSSPKMETSQAAQLITSTLPQPIFRWSSFLLPIGIVATCGAGVSALFANMLLPYLKGWIIRASQETSVGKENMKLRLSLEEVAVEAITETASAALRVANATQSLLNAKIEDSRRSQDILGTIDAGVAVLKQIGDSMHALEKIMEEEMSEQMRIQASIWRGRQERTNKNSQGLAPTNSSSWHSSVEQRNALAINRDSAGRSSAAPTEPMMAPHPKSYMEIVEMVMRGQKPPNIEEIDDSPPNPDQPISKSQLAPRPKPWQVSPEQMCRPEEQSSSHVFTPPSSSQVSGSTQTSPTRSTQEAESIDQSTNN